MEESRLNRRELIKAAGALGASLAIGSTASADATPEQKGKSVVGLTVPKLDRVRVAFIGVGARGSGHVGTMLSLDGVDVKAICDTHKPSLDAAIKHCVDQGRPAPVAYGANERDYQKMLDRDDIDIVLIATPWEWQPAKARHPA